MIRTLVVLLTIALGGCTVIQVENGAVHRIPGMLEVKASSSDEPLVVRSRNYGLHVNRNSFLVGFGSTTSVTFPDAQKCRVLIIFTDDASDDLQEWRELFEDNPNMCFQGG